MVITPRDHTAQSLKSYLTRERFRVHLYTGCNEAIRALYSNVHEVAIVDDVLEDARGLHFIRQARARGFQTPVVLLSDDYLGSLSQLRDETGICRPLTTPVTHPSLRHCLRVMEDAKTNSSRHDRL